MIPITQNINFAPCDMFSQITSHKTISLLFQITDESLCGIATHGKNLRQLHVGSNYGVSDYGVSQVAYKCPHLEVLDVSFCYKVSNYGLEGFFKRGAVDGGKDGQCVLKYLRIKDCAKVGYCLHV